MVHDVDVVSERGLVSQLQRKAGVVKDRFAAKAKRIDELAVFAAGILCGLNPEMHHQLLIWRSEQQRCCLGERIASCYENNRAGEKREIVLPQRNVPQSIFEKSFRSGGRWVDVMM